MKHSAPCSRSKPPPARSSCFSASRGRNHVNPSVDRYSLVMQGSDGNKVPERSGDKVSGVSMIVSATPKDVSDCISSWLAYLQMVNGLCSAGSRLSHCLGGLILDASPNNRMIVTQCQAMWEELVKASTVASSNIKSQVLTALQELSMASTSNDAELDAQRSSQVICSSLVTFINLQYQLCAACCECLGPIIGCNCPTAADSAHKHEPDCNYGMVQQCFQRLFPSPVPSSSYRGARSPLQFPLSSFLGSQRRWSEAAAQEVAGGSDGDNTMRRWSMPWENSKLNDHSAAWPGSRPYPKSKLSVPVGSSQDRSRSTTPESVWHSSMASQEELQEVIQLLSCPMPLGQLSLYQPSPKTHLPGVTLTGCGLDVGNQEPWSEGTTPGSRRGSNSPHRTSWAVPESICHTWTDTPSTDGGYELNPATLDPATLASRKSSSSTDSSSSYSLHSRSTTGSVSGASGGSDSGGPQEVRTHLYSMWSGSDLPFIKLPESNEAIEETSTELQVTPDSKHTFFTPKSH